MIALKIKIFRNKSNKSTKFILLKLQNTVEKELNKWKDPMVTDQKIKH